MKVAATSMLAATVQGIHLSVHECPGTDFAKTIDRVVPTELPELKFSDQKTTPMTLHFNLPRPVIQPVLTFGAILDNGDAQQAAGGKANLCATNLQALPFIKFFPQVSGSPGVRFHPANCNQGTLSAGLQAIKFDVDPGDGHLSMMDFWQGEKFSFVFSLADGEGLTVSCAQMTRFLLPNKQNNIFPEGVATDIEVSYCPWESKSEKCGSGAAGFLAASAPKCCWAAYGDCSAYPGGSGGFCNSDWSVSCLMDSDCPASPGPAPPGPGPAPPGPGPAPPRPVGCKADHYRLTMDGGELNLIAVDENEVPLKTGIPKGWEPRNFKCDNGAMFDQLFDADTGTKNCLQIEGTVMTLNPKDTCDDKPCHQCALDEDNCNFYDDRPVSWTFRKGGDAYQSWCMQEVNFDMINQCKHLIPAVSFPPYGEQDEKFDPSRCSDKWNVRKVFQGQNTALSKSKKATSCSDCDGTFSCFTPEEGCTLAPDQTTCEGLGGFVKGKWVSDGEWCPSPAPPSPPSPPKMCKGQDSAVHFSCMGATRCCGSGTLTPSCIDYDYNSCCENKEKTMAVACAQGQKCGELDGAPVCIPLEEFV